jgi:hypothetical protein
MGAGVVGRCVKVCVCAVEIIAVANEMAINNVRAQRLVRLGSDKFTDYP